MKFDRVLKTMERDDDDDDYDDKGDSQCNFIVRAGLYRLERWARGNSE